MTLRRSSSKMRISAESQSSMTGSSTTLKRYLPSKVTEVPREVLKAYPHTKRVGSYLLGRTLGEGSFAKVKEALHALTGEKVAVKVIDKKKAREDAYVRKNMRREGKLLQMVRHPHVVRLYEILETENSYYLVTELCKGGDLMDYICGKKRLEEKEARKFIRHVLSAVEYMHKVGILHRDLKVENLLLDENKNIKIIDFGLSNAVRVSNTEEGSSFQEYCVTQCGSPAYAAPELLGNKKYGPKVDVWSIGVNLYAMLTGNLPFTVEPFNIKALYQKMLDGNMNPIPDHVSKSCRDLLKAFLTPDPDRRISLQDAMQHPWITDDANDKIEAIPFPNRLTVEDLDQNIVKHMSEHMDFRMSEVIRLVTTNIPNNATATYHLMLRKLRRYLAEERTLGRASQARLATASKQSIQNHDTKVTPGHVIELLPLDNKNASNHKVVDQNASPKRMPNAVSPRRAVRRRQPKHASCPDAEVFEANHRTEKAVHRKEHSHQNHDENSRTHDHRPTDRDQDNNIIRITAESNQRHHSIVETLPQHKMLSPQDQDSPSHLRLDSNRELPEIHHRDQSPGSDLSDRSNSRNKPALVDAKLSPTPGRHQWIPTLLRTSADSSSHSLVSSTGRRSTVSNGRNNQLNLPTSPKLERKVRQVIAKQQSQKEAQAARRLTTSPLPGGHANLTLAPHERSRRLINLAYVDVRQRRASPSRLSPTHPMRRGSFEAPSDAGSLAVTGDRALEARLSARPVLRRGSVDVSPIMKRSTNTLEEKLVNMNQMAVNGNQIHEPSAVLNTRDARVALPAISPPPIRKSHDQDRCI